MGMVLTEEEKAWLFWMSSEIRRRREEQGYTCTGFAARAGLSQPYMSQLEKARVTPNVIVVRRVAKALGISVGELVGDFIAQ